MLMRNVACVLLVMLMFGCARVSTVRIMEPELKASEQTQFEGQATVYVFRDSRSAGALWPFLVSLDKKHVGVIRRGRYLVFPAAAGNHQIEVSCPPFCMFPGFRMDMDLMAGKTYYFLLNTHAIRNYEYSTRLGQIEPPLAESMMKIYVPGSHSDRQ